MPLRNGLSYLLNASALRCPSNNKSVENQESWRSQELVNSGKLCPGTWSEKSEDVLIVTLQYHNIMNNIHNAIGYLPKEDSWYSKKIAPNIGSYFIKVEDTVTAQQ